MPLYSTRNVFLKLIGSVCGKEHPKFYVYVCQVYINITQLSTVARTTLQITLSCSSVRKLKTQTAREIENDPKINLCTFAAITCYISLTHGMW